MVIVWKVSWFGLKYNVHVVPLTIKHFAGCLIIYSEVFEHALVHMTSSVNIDSNTCFNKQPAVTVVKFVDSVTGFGPWFGR